MAILFTEVKGYSHWKIDGTAIKNPSTYSQNKYLQTDIGRVLTGNATGQIINKFIKHSLTWTGLYMKDLQLIDRLLFGEYNALPDILFHNIEFVEDGVWRSFLCYPGALTKTLYQSTGVVVGNEARFTDSDWVWKDIKIDIIQSHGFRSDGF